MIVFKLHFIGITADDWPAASNFRVTLNQLGGRRAEFKAYEGLGWTLEETPD